MSFMFTATLEGTAVVTESLSVFLPDEQAPRPIDDVQPIGEGQWAIAFPVPSPEPGNMIIVGTDESENNLATSVMFPHDMEPIDTTIPRLSNVQVQGSVDGDNIVGEIIIPPEYTYGEALITINDEEIFSPANVIHDTDTNQRILYHPYDKLGPLIRITVLVRMDDGEEFLIPWESGEEPADDLPSSTELLSVRIDTLETGYEMKMRIGHEDPFDIDHSSVWLGLDGRYEPHSFTFDIIDGTVEISVPLDNLDFYAFTLDYNTARSGTYIEMAFTMDTTEEYYDENGDPYTYVRPMPIPDGITTNGSRTEVKVLGYEQHDESRFVMELELDDYNSRIILDRMQVYINGAKYPCEYLVEPYYISRHVRCKVLVTEKPRIIDVLLQDSVTVNPELRFTELNYQDNDIAPYESFMVYAGNSYATSSLYIHLNGLVPDLSTCSLSLDNGDLVSTATYYVIGSKFKSNFELESLDTKLLTVTGQTTSGDPFTLSYAIGERTWSRTDSPTGYSDGDNAVLNTTVTDSVLTTMLFVGNDTPSDIKIGVNGSIPTVPATQTDPADGPITLTAPMITDELATVEVTYVGQDGKLRKGIWRNQLSFGLRYTENDVTVRGLMTDSNEELFGFIEGDLVKDSIKIMMMHEFDTYWGITVTEQSPGVFTFTRPAYIYTRSDDLEGVIVEAELATGGTVKFKYCFGEDYEYPIAGEYDSLEIRGSGHYTSVRYEIPENADDDYSTPNMILNNNRAGKDGYNTTTHIAQERFERVIVSRLNRTTKQYEIFTHIRNESSPLKDSNGDDFTLVQDRRYGASQGAFIITDYDEVYLDGEEAIQVSVLANDLRDGNIEVYYYDDTGEVLRVHPVYTKVADMHYTVVFKHPYDTLPDFSIKYNWYYAEYFVAEDAPPLPKISSVTVTSDAGQYKFDFALDVKLDTVVTQPTVKFSGDYVPIAGPVGGEDGAVTVETNRIDYIDFDTVLLKYLNDFSELVVLSHPMGTTESYVDINGDPVPVSDTTASFYRVERWGSDEAGYDTRMITNETSLGNIEDISEAMYRWESETSWTIATNDLILHDGKVVFVERLPLDASEVLYVRYNRTDGTRVTLDYNFGAIGGIVHYDPNGRYRKDYDINSYEVTPGEGDVETWTFTLKHDAAIITDGQVFITIDDGTAITSTSLTGSTAIFEGQSKAAREAGTNLVLKYTTVEDAVTMTGTMGKGRLPVEEGAVRAFTSAEIDRYGDDNWEFYLYAAGDNGALETEYHDVSINGGDWIIGTEEEVYEVYGNGSGVVAFYMDMYDYEIGMLMTEITSVRTRHVENGETIIHELIIGTIEEYID